MFSMSQGHGHSHGGRPHAHAFPEGGAGQPDLLAAFDQSLAEFQALADNVRPDGWHAVAPNDGWVARDVINHMIHSNDWALSLLDNAHTPRPQGDITGADPAAAFRASCAPISAALHAMNPDDIIRSPFGEMPPAGFAGFLAVHALNHAWELAKATGQSTDLAPALAEHLLAMAKMTIPGGQRPGAPFDPETFLTVENAPAADRLAAYLGHAPETFKHLGPNAATRERHRSMPELVGAAVETTGGIIASIRPDQWDLPTPCTEWTVRDVVAHLVSGNRVLTMALQGEKPGFDAYQHAVDNPAADYIASSETMLALLEAPGAMTGMVELPYGKMPAPAAAGFRFVDLISHGWDLAKATGQSTDFASDLNQTALDMARASMQGRERPAGVIGPEQQAPDGASAADRLAAFLGRVV
jgi:uncharacterized protein (TIGR03086 family)